MARRLAAVMAVDIVGYSRLIELDEAGTLSAVSERLRTLIEPRVRQYHGRIVKLMGDGTLIEYSSAVDAATCAVEIQCAMADRNADTPPEKQIRYRIGINVGDIVVEGDDIFGDGVIIATRLETLAEPGGVCIADSALNQIRGKLDLTFEAMGGRKVKNVSAPVVAHRIVLDKKAAALRTEIAEVEPRQSPRYRDYRVALAACALAAILALAWWQAPVPGQQGVSAGGSPTRQAANPQEDRPTLAVLPFANISGDKEQEYFSDGMTEDLITDLSKLANLRVVSSTTTAGYKGRSIDVREIGKALGVRYIVEGSVRKAGNLIRINAQLTDATSGSHIWAERYDGILDDIFSLQDQVLAKVVDTLALKLSAQERNRLSAKGTQSVAAHDLYLKGLFQESAFTREGNGKARALYEQALSIDPDYALPYTRMANILELNARNGWTDDIQGDLQRAVDLAEKATRLDPENPRTHWSLGRAAARLRAEGSVKRGIKALQRAIELDPDFADAYAFLGVLYTGDGRADDGLRSVETAMRLNPNYPFWYLFMRGMTRYVVEDYDQAIADFEAAIARSPTAPFLRWWLAAAYAQAGRMDDAEWQVEELYLTGFDGSISTILETNPIQYPPYVKLYREGLVKAGLPEG
ncbi:MAG TPA: adenylate/guanylate cyclase domain-containing protein [Afifellaceae bacterium]|nr:adenylate/guanylate cyclase domain-containing protein [Afifellaceae bacterium]